MSLRLVYSRPCTSDVLLNALCKAAHNLIWAEDAAKWHRRLPDGPDYERARKQALARVERILLHAERCHIITGTGVRRLMGVVFDAMVASRWRHAPKQIPGLDVANQIAALPRTLRQVWHVYSNVEQVLVFTSPTAVRVLTRADELAGDPVVPGFRLPVAALFPPSAPAP